MVGEPHTTGPYKQQELRGFCILAHVTISTYLST